MLSLFPSFITLPKRVTLNHKSFSRIMKTSIFLLLKDKLREPTHTSRKNFLKERFENASDLNGEKKIRILMWTVLGMKSSHII